MEVETWTDAATDQAPSAAAVCGLPVVGGDHVQRSMAGRRADGVHRDVLEVGWGHQQLEFMASQEMPQFIGPDAVPATRLAGLEQVVDDGQSGSVAASISRFDSVCRPVDFPEVATLWMRFELEFFDQLLGRCQLEMEWLWGVVGTVVIGGGFWGG